MSKLIPITTPLRVFKGHKDGLGTVAVFPDKRRMITGSWDNTLRLWDLKTGVLLKKMEGHRTLVTDLVVSRDGQLIASCGSDDDAVMIVWHGETGEPLTQFAGCASADFSPDGAVMAMGSWEGVMQLWNTKTWQQLGNPITCGSNVYRVRYSPSGKLLAIATYHNIQIYNSGTRKRVTFFKGHTRHNYLLAWTPDGTRLLTAGDQLDPTIREWDTTTWQQVGVPWTDRSDYIFAIAIHPAGTLITSVTRENHVHLWRLSDRRTVAIFKHSESHFPTCVTFSVDGKYILSGGKDKMISEWEVPQGIHSKARLRH
jgi:WD40 repeat protein